MRVTLLETQASYEFFCIFVFELTKNSAKLGNWQRNKLFNSAFEDIHVIDLHDRDLGICKDFSTKTG